MESKWNIEITDPSGEKRVLNLRNSPLTINQVLKEEIPCPVELTPFLGSFWLKSTGAPDTVRVGDHYFIDGQIPVETPITIGNTKITIKRAPIETELPEFPKGYTPWLAASESGIDVITKTKKIAKTKLSVYIAGETGTGKEILASLIHGWSENASGPFIPLNCGALAESVAESELFGHTKGSFTGAHKDRPGALLQAHGGTLFLDEIADLSHDLQAKLLRFLENGEVRPVGSDRILHSKTRIVCATHKPLRQLVIDGKFRRDLYYRLASISIEIPPLRARLEDIDFLSSEFARGCNRTLSHPSIIRLRGYEWPGNVRELKHAIERASTMASQFDPTLGSEHFEFLNEEASSLSENGKINPLGSRMMTMKEIEKAMVMRSLKLAQGHRATAAKLLGVARSTLFDMMKRHGIRGPRMSFPDPTALTQYQFSKKHALHSPIRQ
ncbi:MAG: sigma-54-dependent Fis family transcriptional regulator [Xanthomonadaceae bacterium]|nr:sigma-54-dependent Fis family transcriptional regulator [Xanthomonadaceae bacterium]